MGKLEACHRPNKRIHLTVFRCRSIEPRISIRLLSGASEWGQNLY